MASADPFAELTPTPYTADTPFWCQPDPLYADNLTGSPPTGDIADGGSYTDIPQFANAIFTEHPDAPPNSVPAAMAPAYSEEAPSQFPPKDSD